MFGGDPVEVFRARDAVHAHIVKAALENEGIAARVVGEELQNALGELPLGWSSSPSILVDEADAPRARDILESLE